MNNSEGVRPYAPARVFALVTLRENSIEVKAKGIAYFRRKPQSKGHIINSAMV